MNLTFSDVKVYSSTLKVLYVEDEDSIREQFYSIYVKLFSEVIVAKDGESGLEAFYKHRPDIVISDIRMPIMDGIEMSQKTKNEDPNVQVILTTAHSDGEFLMRAIDAGVDRYILKPIDREKLIGALLASSRNICDRFAAQKLKMLELQEHINSKASSIVSKIVDAIPNAVVSLQEDKIVFANKAFCSIVSEEVLKNIDLGVVKIEDIFSEYKEESTESSDANDTCANKVSVQGPKGRKIYQICKANIDMDENDTQTVFVFSDITRLEYQKIKLKHYSEHLEEFFYNNLKKEQSRAIKALTSEQIHEQVGEEHITTAANMLAIDGKIAQNFGEQELKILRKSRHDKTTSVEYMQEVGKDIAESLEDLQEADGELEEQILMLNQPIDKADLHGLSAKLMRYSTVINQMFDFADLAVAVKTLSEFMMELHANDIDDKQYRQLVNYLTNIKDDLRSWRLTNFVTQNADNIHYLDASLMSSCLQLQMAFMPKSPIDDDDDLGLDLF